MTPDPIAEPRTDCEELLELATPTVYRRNLFRVLGLPVSASAKDVQRREARRRMEARLGLAAAGARSGTLGLDPAPGEDDTRAAIDRLNRPVDRWLDEVFWFWPIVPDGAPDPARQLVEAGDLGAATAQWSACADGGASAALAAHNVAVALHLGALDLELAKTAGMASSVDVGGLPDLWSRAVRQWKLVVDGDEFWRAARERVRQIDDVQLTTGFVARVRATFPLALGMISARLACEQAERGDLESARRCAAVVHAEDLFRDVADEAFRRALAPLRDRLSTAVETAKQGWAAKPQRGAHHVRSLHEQASPILAIVDAVLPTSSGTRDSMHDSVAQAMLEGQVAYAAKTEDWDESVRLLGLARGVVAGTATRDKIAENLDIVTKNAKSGGRWCAPGYWDLADDVVARLEEIRLKAKSGDPEAAMGELASLDPAIGAPLHRCVAYCLSARGWQLVGEATQQLATPPKNLKRFIEEIGRRGSVQVPSPEMGLLGIPLPNCPACGSRYYTQWSRGKFNGQDFWLCESCARADNEERERRRRGLSDELRKAYEFFQLAAEVDANDHEVKESLAFITKQASEFGIAKPDTKRLRSRWAKPQGGAGIRRDFTPAPAASRCHFCGAAESDPAAQILVPVAGEPHKVPVLFGTADGFYYGDAVVPRCGTCHAAHRDAAQRDAAWRAARASATADESLPAEARAAKSADDDVAAAQEARRQAGAALQAAERHLKDAEKQAASRCRKCSAPLDASRVCKKCDSDVRGIGRAAGNTLVLVLPCVAFVLKVFQPVLLPIVLPILLVGTLAWGRNRQAGKRAVLVAERARAAKAHQTALQSALAAVAAATAAAERSNEAVEASERRVGETKAALAAARASADARFVQSHPRPAQPDGVRPEASFVEAPTLRSLLERGYRFGRELDAAASAPTDPMGVRGLVAVAEPAPAAAPQPRKHKGKLPF